MLLLVKKYNWILKPNAVSPLFLILKSSLNSMKLLLWALQRGLIIHDLNSFHYVDEQCPFLLNVVDDQFIQMIQDLKKKKKEKQDLKLLQMILISWNRDELPLRKGLRLEMKR